MHFSLLVRSGAFPEISTEVSPETLEICHRYNGRYPQLRHNWKNGGASMGSMKTLARRVERKRSLQRFKHGATRGVRHLYKSRTPCQQINYKSTPQITNQFVNENFEI